MTALIISVLAVALVGGLCWAQSRPRSAIGATLPAGAGITTTAITWVIATWAGAGYVGGWAWAQWLLPFVLGSLVAVVTARLLTQRRASADTARLTQILKG